MSTLLFAHRIAHNQSGKAILPPDRVRKAAPKRKVRHQALTAQWGHMVRFSGLFFVVLFCAHSLDVVGAPVATDEAVRAIGWQHQVNNALGQEVQPSAVSQEINKRSSSEPEPVVLLQDTLLQINGVKREPQQVNRLYFSSLIEGDQNNQVAIRRASDDPPGVTATLPDLIVTELNGPLNGIAGEVIQVSTTVLNQGDAPAGAFRVTFLLSTNNTISLADRDTEWGCTRSSGLLPGQSSTCSGEMIIPADVAPGTYYLGAYADSGQEVAEESEVNNGLATNVPMTITVELPDLIVTDINGPLTGIAGKPIQVSTIVLNQGDARAGTFRVTFLLSTDSTISLADRDIEWGCTRASDLTKIDSGLLPGQSYTCDGEMIIPADVAPGTYYLGAYADSGQEVAEESEVNNGLATNVPMTITVELPDLIVTDINGPLTGIAGKPIQVSTAYLNQGDAPAGAFRVTFLLSTDSTISLADRDTEWGCTRSSGLLPGQSSTCSGEVMIPADIAPGTYYLGAYADSGQEVAEESEVNNGLATAAAMTIKAEGSSGAIFNDSFESQQKSARTIDFH